MYRTEKITGKQEIPAYLEEYVNIEEFLPYCRECDSYNEIWSCPDFDFDVLGYWNQYDYIHILGTKILFDQSVIEEERTPEELRDFIEKILKKEKQKLAEILFEKEQEYPGSISLSAGSCHLCEVCEKVYNRPCKYPDKLRYSMEALGADVGRTCSKLLRSELLWSEENKLPEYFILISALLSKEPDIEL